MLLLSWYGGDVALHSMEHASGRSRISCYCGRWCFLVDPFEMRSFNKFHCRLDEGMRFGWHLIWLILSLACLKVRAVILTINEAICLNISLNLSVSLVSSDG